MSVPPGPDPDEHQPPDERHSRLSPWEKRIVAQIEGDLTTNDPSLARRMRWPATRWWPLSARSTVTLLIGLALLSVAAMLIPASGWAWLAVVTTLVILPWLVLAATERRRDD